MSNEQEARAAVFALVNDRITGFPTAATLRAALDAYRTACRAALEAEQPCREWWHGDSDEELVFCDRGEDRPETPWPYGRYGRCPSCEARTGSTRGGGG